MNISSLGTSRLSLDGVTIRTCLIWGLLYFLAIELTLVVRESADSLAAVWPASGVILAGLLLSPQSRTLPLVATAGIVNFGLNWLVGKGLPFCLSLAIANCAEPLVVISAMRMSPQPMQFLDSPGKLVKAFFVPTTLGAAVSAVLGAAAISTFRDESFGYAYRYWFASDMVGMLIITPWIIEILRAIRGGRWRYDFRMALIATTVYLGVIRWTLSTEIADNLGLRRPYVLLPLLFSAAIVFQPIVVTTLVMGNAAIAMATTARGTGPFADWTLIPQPTLIRDIQTFVGVLAASSLLMVSVAQRTRAVERELRASHDSLEHVVQHRTEQLQTALESARQEMQQRASMQEQLTASEARARAQWLELEQIYQTAPVGLALLDDQLRYLRINERMAEINGQPIAEHLGRPVREVLPTVADTIVPLLKQVLDTGRAVEIADLRGYLPAEPEVQRSWSVVYYPVFLGSEKRVGGIVEERTQQRRLEQKLDEHRNELAHAGRLHLLNELAAGLAHELNQPLQAIANYAQGCALRLQKPNGDREEILQAIGMINHEASRAAEVVRGLRSFARKQSAGHVPVDLNSVAQDVARLLKVELDRHTVGLVLDLSPQLPTVEGDRIQLEQVLVNLVVNGIHATAKTAEERRVTIATRHSGGWIELTVSDNGTGLPTDDPERVFEPFFTTGEVGIGLGLPICRSIVEAHDGLLTARSLSPHGAQFMLQLPWSAQETRGV